MIEPLVAANAFVAIGSNLADSAQQVLTAFDAIAALPRTSLQARSTLYLTAPVGYADQPDFINAVVHIHTKLPPQRLLLALLEIEERLGRQRTFRNAPRVIDLDVLLYNDIQINDVGLTLPHPRMHERAFVLVPLIEIAPDLIIPGYGRAVDCLSNIDNGHITRVDDNWQRL